MAGSRSGWGRARASAAQAADGLSIAGLAVFGVIGTAGAALQADYPHRSPDALAFALVVAGPVLLLARRRRPVAVLLANVLLNVVYFAADYPYGPMPLALCVAVYDLAAGRDRRQPAGAGPPAVRVRTVFGLAAVALVAILVTELGGTVGTGGASGGGSLASFLDSFLDVVPVWVITVAAPIWIGLAVRARRQQAVEAARRREAEDRLRLARELHDVVGHSLSMISFRAGVALHVLDRRPEQARSALAAIRAASTDALRELRATLGMLRQPGDRAGPLAPAAGLALLPALVDELGQVGRAVAVRVDGTPADLPLDVDLAAYRIVQEALTNVARHAPGPARATVRLAFPPVEGAALVVEVLDDGGGAGATSPPRRAGGGVDPPAPAGHGVAGMRERAEAVGGALEAGPRPGGGFQVWARLPLRPPDAAPTRQHPRPGEAPAEEPAPPGAAALGGSGG
jgi:signal transduction histidine kinase